MSDEIIGRVACRAANGSATLSASEQDEVQCPAQQPDGPAPRITAKRGTCPQRPSAGMSSTAS